MKQAVVEKLYKLSYLFWYLFLLTLPLGARLIIKPRLVDGVFVEWGTISIFASEIVLLFFCFFVFLLTIFDWQTIKGRILEFKKVLIALAAFLILALIPALNSEFFGFSIFWFFRLIEVSLLFLSAIILRPTFKTTAIVFSLSLIPSLLLGVFQFGFQFSPANKWFGIAEHLPQVLGTSVIGISIGRFLRAYGTLPHPNILAAYLAVNFWLLLFLTSNIKREALQRSRQIMLLLLYFLFFLNFYVLFLTFSRAAWLALGLSLIILFVRFRESLGFPKPNKQFRGILILFSALLVLALILGYSHSDLIFSRMDTASYLENKSISERVAGFGEAKEIIFKSPLSSPFGKGGLRGILFGVGPGAHTYALAQKFPELSPYALQPVHNVWLLILAELGIFGFLAFIVFLIFLFKSIRAASRYKFAIILSLFILSFFDHYLWSLWQGLILGALVLTSIVFCDKVEC